MDEEAAKQAWLAKLDVPSWGPQGGVVPVAAAPVAAPMATEDAAKAAWLAKLDVPSWGPSPKVAQLTEDCNAGFQQACHSLDVEQAAKAAWLAKLDAPTWGR